MRADKERLLDIQEAIERIEKYAGEGKEAFEASELIQVWIAHHLQMIGEAVNRLSDEARDLEPQIPWHQIVGMRNILIHEYFAVDTELVWAVVEKDLASLKNAVGSMIEKLETESESESPPR